MVARISATVETPYEDRPFEGLFSVSTEISPMASPMFENNRLSEDEILISRLVEKAVRRSGALDLESLCIVAGQKCWSVRADVHFLDYDGGFIDASCIAVITGLLYFKKADITVSGETVTIHPTSERSPVSLSVLHVPICITFSFFNPTEMEENIKGDSNQEICIVDATLQEENLRNGVFTITINKNREICQISKAGGLPIDALTLMNCCNSAYHIATRLTEQIKDVLKKNDERRNAGNIRKLLSAENDR